MKIHITEEQHKKLFEARIDGFRLDVLVSAGSFKRRLEYCKKMLGRPIGSGSSRVVFQLDDYSVLKLAKNPKGIAQNMEEIRLGTEPYLSLLPKVLNGTDENNGLWIVSEYVLPAKKADFKKVLGIPFDILQRFVWSVFMDSKPGYNKFADSVRHELYDEYEQNDDVIDLFNEIHVLCMDFNQDIGDLKQIANWGMCMRNGRPTIVILDSGLSFEIYDTYYNRFKNV